MGVRRYRLALACTLWIAMGVHAAAPAEPEAERLDNAAFAQGLLDRELITLLDAFLQQHTPADPIEAALLGRIAHLRIYIDPNQPAERRLAALADANGELRDLIAQHPDHARADQWRMALAYDLIQREAEPAINKVLYGLAEPTDVQALGKLAQEATALLRRVLRDLDSVTDGETDPVAHSAMRGRAAFFAAWADLWRAMCLSAADPVRATLAQGVVDALDARGWLNAGHRDAALQARSQLMAGMAARLLRQWDLAGRRLADASSSITMEADAPQRPDVAWTTVAARLERVRLAIDRGDPAAADRAVRELQHWLDANRHHASRALTVATALFEADVCYAQANATPRPVDASALRRQAHQRLLALCTAEPAYRDVIFRHVWQRPDPRGQPADRDPFEQAAHIARLIAQGHHADALNHAQTLRDRQDPMADALQAYALYAIAQCHFALGQPIGAARQYATVAQRYPDSPDARRAIVHATDIAADLFADPQRLQADTRALFRDALKTLTELFPDTPEAAERWYDLGYVLYQDGDAAAAADAFARTTRDDPRYLDAQYWRVMCLFDWADRVASEEVWRRAVDAALDYASIATHASHRDRLRHDAGQTIVMAADALNRPPLNDPDTALQLATQAHAQFGDIETIAAEAIRIRLASLQQLGRLAEAQRSVDDLLKTDPSGAGPVVARLLMAMNQVNRASSDPTRLTSAATLADRLHAWLAGDDRSLADADRSFILSAIAEAWLAAGRADDALTAYRRGIDLDQQRADITAAPHPVEPRLLAGQAECLYQLGRISDALTIFQDRLYRRLPEGRPLWWRAYLRSLQCHAKLNAAADTEPTRQALRRILQSIATQRRRTPDMGSPTLLQQFNHLEADVQGLLKS